MSVRRELRVSREHSFSAPVRLIDGRVVGEGTAPYLFRLRGITEQALRAMAEAKGWEIEEVKSKSRRATSDPAAKVEVNPQPEEQDHDQIDRKAEQHGPAAQRRRPSRFTHGW